MVSDERYARLLQHPRSDSWEGCVVTDPPPRGASSSDPRYRRQAEREVMIALAGGVAVARLRGRSWREDGVDSRKVVIALGPR